MARAICSLSGEAPSPSLAPGALVELDRRIEVAPRALEARLPVAQVPIDPEAPLLAVASLKGVEDVLVRLNQARNALRVADDDEGRRRPHQHARGLLRQQQHAVVRGLADELVELRVQLGHGGGIAPSLARR